MSKLPTFTPISLSLACHSKWPPPEYVIGPAQIGDLILLSGADGLGKSWCAMTAGFAVAKGVSALGGMWNVPQVSGKVLYVAVEDRPRDHGERLQKIAQQAQILNEVSLPSEDQEDDTITVWPLAGQRVPLARPSKEPGNRYEFTNLATWFEKSIVGYHMVIIDPLRSFHDLDEVDGAGMDFLARGLVSMAMRNRQTIFAVHHASQGAILQSRDDHHAGRGATDFPAACRAV